MQFIDRCQHRRGVREEGNSEFQRFLQIASGSASELDHHLLLARDLGFIEAARYQILAKSLVELRRMLTALLTKVESKRRLVKC